MLNYANQCGIFRDFPKEIGKTISKKMATKVAIIILSPITFPLSHFIFERTFLRYASVARSEYFGPPFHSLIARSTLFVLL